MESQIENLKIEQKPSPAETRINSSRFQFADSNCREFRLIEQQLFPSGSRRCIHLSFTFSYWFYTFYELCKKKFQVSQWYCDPSVAFNNKLWQMIWCNFSDKLGDWYISLPAQQFYPLIIKFLINQPKWEYLWSLHHHQHYTIINIIPSSTLHHHCTITWTVFQTRLRFVEYFSVGRCSDKFWEEKNSHGKERNMNLISGALYKCTLDIKMVFNIRWR